MAKARQVVEYDSIVVDKARELFMSIPPVESAAALIRIVEKELKKFFKGAYHTPGYGTLQGWFYTKFKNERNMAMIEYGKGNITGVSNSGIIHDESKEAPYVVIKDAIASGEFSISLTEEGVKEVLRNGIKGIFKDGMVDVEI